MLIRSVMLYRRRGLTVVFGKNAARYQASGYQQVKQILGLHIVYPKSMGFLM